ncbi:MAG: hypothetical protein H0T89_12305 [Deltaproteobacteria bacterium]|nr:hypothetical protein [Deltaproteobacteria bacterium]MDQ3296302.1 hypothetical protein [Myxococcota bacterium]
MSLTIDDIEWHDASLAAVEIFRRATRTVVRCAIESSDPVLRALVVEFVDCYQIEIVATFESGDPENIQSFREVTGEKLVNVQNKWRWLLADDVTTLRLFEINTGALEASHQIVARHCEVMESEGGTGPHR